MRNTKKSTMIERNDGFTLVELLIVITLIGFIGTFAITQLTSKLDKAKVDGTKIQMRNLGSVLDQFKIDCGRYPTGDEGLEALVEKPAGLSCRNYDPAGYLKKGKIPRDGFNNEFIYESENGQKYTLISWGQDNQEGGSGYAQDISSDNIDGDPESEQ